MSFDGLLIHKCDIYRPTSSAGIYGENIKSGENLIVADEQCRYAEKDERRVVDSVSEDLVATTYLLLLPADSTAQERDIVRNIELDSSTVISGPFWIDQLRNRFGKTGLVHKSAVIRLTDQ